MPTQVVKSKKLFIPIITILGMVLILTGLFNLTGMFNDDNTNSDVNPLILWAPETVQAQSNCDITVSPGGLAGGISSIQAGQTLCLRDGTYYESLSVSKSGTASNPITIRAVNDGEAVIDGQNSRQPMKVSGNYITVEGLVIKNSSGHLVNITGDNNTLRRCSAYFGPDGMESSGFLMDEAEGNLLEDCVAGSVGRHIFNSWAQSGKSTHNTFRRCLGIGTIPDHNSARSEFNCYGCSDNIYENCIGWGDTEYASISVHSQGYASTYKCRNNQILGSIFMRSGKRGGDPDPGLGLLLSRGVDGSQEDPRNNYFENCIIYGNTYGVRLNTSDNTIFNHCTIMNSGHYGLSSENSSDVIKNTLIYNNNQGSSSTQGSFSYINTYGNSSGNTPPSGCQNCSIINPGNIGLTVPNNSPMKGAGENGADIGANICYRYQNGVLTNQPLWPWPMQDRIKAELGIDVMAELEELFGPIPDECKGQAVNRPNITLTKSAIPTSASLGQDITYTIHYQNTGTASADSVVITDIIPTGVKLDQSSIQASHSSADCSVVNSTLSCTYPTIPVGAEGEIKFRVRVE